MTPRLLRHHALQRFTGAEEGAGEVDVEHLLPGGDVDLPGERPGAIDAGVVDQHVDAAPGRVERGEHRLDRGGVADIGLDGDGLAAVRLQPGDERLGFLGVADVVDGNLGAGCAEGLHHRGAEAGVAAGDQDAPGVKIDLHGGGTYRAKRKIATPGAIGLPCSSGPAGQPPRKAWRR